MSVSLDAAVDESTHLVTDRGRLIHQHNETIKTDLSEFYSELAANAAISPRLAQDPFLVKENNI